MQAGDDDAVRALYALYGQRLYAYALRLTNDPATAEDVTQTSLVTAWRTACTFRSEGCLIAWLLGIVHHTAMKTLRGKTNYLDEVAEESIREDQPSPEEQAQVKEERRWIRQGTIIYVRISIPCLWIRGGRNQRIRLDEAVNIRRNWELQEKKKLGS